MGALCLVLVFGFPEEEKVVVCCFFVVVFVVVVFVVVSVLDALIVLRQSVLCVYGLFCSLRLWHFLVHTHSCFRPVND